MLDMIKLLGTAGSATIVRADLMVEETGMAGDQTIGYVMCRITYPTDSTGRTRIQYVTWAVYLQEDGKFLADTGYYFDNDYEAALENYNKRRKGLATHCSKIPTVE